MLLLSLVYNNVHCFTFNCKLSIENQTELLSQKFPDQIACVADVLSYDGEEPEMASFHSTAENSDKKKEQNLLLKHSEKQTLTNVTESVKFKGHRFEIHPKGIGSMFPSLKSISLENGNLFRITKEDLKQFPDALILVYSYNNIQYLETDLFIYNTKIEGAYFTNNKIIQISPKLGLEKLPSFVAFTIDNNMCYDEIYFCEPGQDCPLKLSNFMKGLLKACPELETQMLTDIKDEIKSIDKELSDVQSNEAEDAKNIKKIETQVLQLSNNVSDEFLKIKSRIDIEAVKTSKIETQITDIYQKMTEVHRNIVNFNEIIDRVYNLLQLAIDDSN